MGLSDQSLFDSSADVTLQETMQDASQTVAPEPQRSRSPIARRLFQPVSPKKFKHRRNDSGVTVDSHPHSPSHAITSQPHIPETVTSGLRISEPLAKSISDRIMELSAMSPKAGELKLSAKDPFYRPEHEPTGVMSGLSMASMNRLLHRQYQRDTKQELRYRANFPTDYTEDAPSADIITACTQVLDYDSDTLSATGQSLLEDYDRFLRQQTEMSADSLRSAKPSYLDVADKAFLAYVTSAIDGGTAGTPPDEMRSHALKLLSILKTLFHAASKRQMGDDIAATRARALHAFRYTLRFVVPDTDLPTLHGWLRTLLQQQSHGKAVPGGINAFHQCLFLAIIGCEYRGLNEAGRLAELAVQLRAIGFDDMRVSDPHKVEVVNVIRCYGLLVEQKQ